MAEMGWQLISLALVLLIMAGISGSLAVFAVGLLAMNGVLIVRPDFAHLVSPGWVTVYAMLAVLQICADLYFVPERVRDRQYLDERRTANAYLHARFQSFFRPVIAVLVVAALPLSLPVQPLAVAAFVLGSAVYWFSAWIREFVAMRRGAIVLTLLETAKHLGVLLAVLLAHWLPVLTLALIVILAAPVALWASRLQREHREYRT